MAPARTAAPTSSSIVSTAPALISGPQVTPSSNPLPTLTAAIAAASRAANSSATPASTRNRLAAVHVSAEWRILATIAPSTAASRSASSNTMNGALPPSSMTVLSTRSAQRRSSDAADLGRPGERHHPDRPMVDRGVEPRTRRQRRHHVDQPLGHARLGQQLGDPQRGERRLPRWLDHDAVPGGQRRSELAGDHRGREVPRGDHHDDTDGRVVDEDPVGPGGDVPSEPWMRTASSAFQRKNSAE